jgi:CRISPR-associated protein Csc2
MSVLDNYKDFLAESYENFPKGRYVSILLLRKTKSETIFRTESEGGLNKEFVRGSNGIEQRVLMTKRKQIAVERRTGRELLRRYDKLGGKDDDVCALNRNNPCGECVDCMVYGFAVGGGGAQKSRVISNDAYSLLPAKKVSDKRTFNALFDNGTMVDPDSGKNSTSLGEVEYIKPGTHFVDIETLKDVTKEELIYILANILRSKRYGAISSKIGKMDNYILGVYFSDCELVSNLELTQEIIGEVKSTEFPLLTEEIKGLAKDKMNESSSNVFGKVVALEEDRLKELLEEIKAIYSNDEKLEKLLDDAKDKY